MARSGAPGWVRVITVVAGLVAAPAAMSAPVCGETTCQPIAGTSFSHFLDLDCNGVEYHYPVYNGADTRPYSWDGGGLGGTQGTTANPLSFRDTSGNCTNRAVPGDLSGLLRVYRCGAGELQCGGACVPSGQCCITADCGSPPPNASAVACVGNLCQPTCAAGYTRCGRECITGGSCCTASDCTTPDVCHKLPATCANHVCGYAANDGALCDADGTRCTPNDTCLAGTCVADVAHTVSCVQKDCNTATCNPTSGNCEYTATSGGACGATGCYSVGTCSAGVCSGAPKDCSAVSTSACTAPACDGATGNCTVENVPNGTPCALADKCLQDVGCSGGVCVGNPKVCAPSGPCVVAECDAGTGACVESPLAAGTPCVATDPCSPGDGVCGTDSLCRGSALADGTPCERKMSCAGGEGATCSSGTCRCPGELGDADLGVAGDGGGVGSASGKGCSFSGSPASGAAWPLLLVMCAAAFAFRSRRLIAALALLTAAHAVRAEEPDPRGERAHARYEAGAALYGAGVYDEARRNFEDAYRISGRPELLYNVAVCDEKLGQLERAADGFERFLELVPRAENRLELTDRIRTLRERAHPKRRPRPRWLWGVVGGSIGVAVALGVGLGVGLTVGRSRDDFSTNLPSGGPGAR